MKALKILLALGLMLQNSAVLADNIDEGAHHNLKEHLSSFLAGLPQEPEAALRFIVEKFNLAQSQPESKHIQFVLKLADQVPQGRLFEFTPSFGQENQFSIEITLQKSLVKNPIYILEVLSGLQQVFNLESSYDLVSKKYYTGTNPHQYFHPITKEFVTNHHIQIPYHFHQELIHSAFDAMGMKMNPSTRNLSPMAWAELKINAKRGSPYAFSELAKIEDNGLKTALNSYSSFSLIKNLSTEERIKFLKEVHRARGTSTTDILSEPQLAAHYFNSQNAALAERVAEADRQARAQYTRERNWLEDPQLKELKNALERQPQKLNDLVKANDREGVARLLEAFIPLNIMEPVERGLWQDWIEAIRRPQAENARLLFRGLDAQNDRPQTVVDSQGREIGQGYLSTLLNRNQGNFTRRLRSVVGMRYRFQNPNLVSTTPVASPPLISSMMRNHALDPIGSPMMSFTTSLDVAARFSQNGGLAAVKVDSRRVLPNIVSIFKNELELLVPLIIFPDEVIHAVQGEKSEIRKADGTTEVRYGLDREKFVQVLNAKLGHDYSTEVTQETKKVFLDAYRLFADATDEPLLCRKALL